MAHASLAPATGGVFILTIERPERANALDLPTAERIGQILDDVRGDGRVKALVVTGAGARFCAGGDLGSLLGAASLATALEELVVAVGGLVRQLSGLTVPVVAAVQGVAAGAGVGLALSCDAVVASTGATFFAAYSSVGLTPDCGTTWFLARAVGSRRALSFLLSPTGIDADEAYRWGIVDALAEGDAHVEMAVDRAVHLSRISPYVREQTRRLAVDATTVDLATLMADEQRTIVMGIREEGVEHRLRSRFARR